MSLSKIQTIVVVIFSIVIFTAIGTSVYFYSKYKSTQGNVAGASDDTKILTMKVGKLIEIPTNEDPAVATVNDVTKLRDQPFFSNAKNGDKVLVFARAKKAILYDPIANKIIEVGPVTLPTPTGSTEGSPKPVMPSTSPNPSEPISASKSPTPTTVSTVSVILYNGTSTPSLTNTIQNLIKEKTQNVQITQTAQASRDTYEKTIVVDLRGTKKDSAATLAQLVSGEVGDLPVGEKKPANADFLVIIGAPKNAPSPTL